MSSRGFLSMTGAGVSRRLIIPGTDRSNVIALAGALLLDRLFGEPPNLFHPVVWLGRLISGLDRKAPASAPEQLRYGALMTAAVCVSAALPAWLLQRASGGLPLFPKLLLLATAIKPALAWRSLEEHALRVLAPTETGDLEAARYSLSMIVSRDTSALDEPRVIAAAIESVAENLSDSVIAPLWWYAVAGLPGVWLYRAANTLDAMVGYRTARYEHLGKVGARLDDVLNWVPARLTSLLILCAGVVAGGDLQRGWTILRRDGAATASPNAGRPMAAMAGVLGVELEKVGHYRLGAGLPPPDPVALRRAIGIMRLAASFGAIVSFTVLGATRNRG